MTFTDEEKAEIDWCGDILDESQFAECIEEARAIARKRRNEALAAERLVEVYVGALMREPEDDER